MAPLPHNGTNILYVDYSTAAAEHTQAIRTTASVSQGNNVATWYADLLDTLGTLIGSRTITSARWQEKNTNFTYPVEVEIIGETYGTGVVSNFQDARFLDFVGRSSFGRRCRFPIFGVIAAVPDDFRFTTADQTEIAQAVVKMNQFPNVPVSIDDVKPVWYGYANVGVNAYWQRAHRS